MTPRRTRPPQHRTSRPQRPRPDDIWQTAAPLPDVEPITVPEEVGTLLRSLGDPPMIAGSVSHYFIAVIERAAAVAAALALSADLLTETTDEQAQRSHV